MARLKDDAQWIVLMGFLVSFSFFFLAILINQSTVVGQTTAEAVSEFPKNDIRGVRAVIIQDGLMYDDVSTQTTVKDEIKILSISRQNAWVDFSSSDKATSEAKGYTTVVIHYNNGVTAYDETWTN
jgi:hypothetical protein